MWIMCNNAFLSIVHKDCEPDELLVRARRKGDIERVFGGVEVERTPGNDYLFRARIKREIVSSMIGANIAKINYPNFKNSVRQDALHRAYARVWSIMAALQSIAPFASR